MFTQLLAFLEFDIVPISTTRSLKNKEENKKGWIQLIMYLVNGVLIKDIFMPFRIFACMDYSPARNEVIQFSRKYELSAVRATNPNMKVNVECNICILYACLADILAGPISVSICTQDTIDYFISILTGSGVGDDEFSLSYDSYRRAIWQNGSKLKIPHFVPQLTPGDTVGCLINFINNEMSFSLNGITFRVNNNDFINVARRSGGVYGAASFMTFQHCIFNFGNRPFKYPPTYRCFRNFNDYGYLQHDEKQVIPRRIILEQLQSAPIVEDCCLVCYDNASCCVFEPYGQRGFCTMCTRRIRLCPFSALKLQRYSILRLFNISFNELRYNKDINVIINTK